MEHEISFLFQTMILADEDDDDPFSNKLFSFQQDGPGGVDLFSPVIVGRKTLLGHYSLLS